MLANYPNYALSVDSRGRFTSKRRDENGLTFRQAVIADNGGGSKGLAYYNALRRDVSRRLHSELFEANAQAMVETAPSLLAVYNSATFDDALRAKTTQAATVQTDATAADAGPSTTAAPKIAKGSAAGVVTSKLKAGKHSPVATVTPNAGVAKAPSLKTGPAIAAEQAAAEKAEADAKAKLAAIAAKAEKTAAGKWQAFKKNAAVLGNKASQSQAKRSVWQRLQDNSVVDLAGWGLALAGIAALGFAAYRKWQDRRNAKVEVTDAVQLETLALPAPYAAPQESRHQFRPTEGQQAGDLDLATAEDITLLPPEGRSAADVAEPHDHIIHEQKHGLDVSGVPAEAFVVDSNAAARDADLKAVAEHGGETGLENDCFGDAKAKPVSVAKAAAKVGGFALLMGALAAGTAAAVIAAKQHVDENKANGAKRPGPRDARLGSYAGPVVA